MFYSCILIALRWCLFCILYFLVIYNSIYEYIYVQILIICFDSRLFCPLTSLRPLSQSMMLCTWSIHASK